MAEENPKEKEEKEGDEDVSEEEVDEEELERQRLAAADAASDDLLAASAKNDLGAALKALSIASEVDRVDGKGATSLGWAALHGNVRLVDALLEKNAHKQYLEACAMREKRCCWSAWNWMKSCRSPTGSQSCSTAISWANACPAKQTKKNWAF